MVDINTYRVGLSFTPNPEGVKLSSLPSQEVIFESAEGKDTNRNSASLEQLANSSLSGDLKSKKINMIINFQEVMKNGLESPPADSPALQSLAKESPIHITSLITDDPTIQHIQSKETEATNSLSTFKEALEDLDKLKKDLGGSPNYADKRPTPAAGKKFLFLPLETVRTWVSNAVAKNWFPSVLWQALSKSFDIKAPFTKYEYASLTVQSFSQLASHQSEVCSRLLKKDNAADYFHAVSGLTCHTTANAPGVLVSSLNETLDLFEKHYQHAKKEGKLQEFFEQAFDTSSICFEARARTLQEYASKYPIDPDQNINVDLVVDRDPNHTFEQALVAELTAFREDCKLKGRLTEDQLPSAEEFKKYLFDEVRICEREAFPKEGEEKRKFTKEDVHALVDTFKDWCLLE